MDILLQRFLEHDYPSLSTEEQHLFEEFLEETDLDILSWIMGREQPENKAYMTYITRLQRAPSSSTETER